jgi:hypothetical protein
MNAQNGSLPIWRLSGHLNGDLVFCYVQAATPQEAARAAQDGDEDVDWLAPSVRAVRMHWSTSGVLTFFGEGFPVFPQ